MTQSPGAVRQAISERDLHGYIDGELPIHRRAEVESYLAAHPNHAALLAEFSALTLSLHGLYGIGPPANPGVDALTAELDRALRRRRRTHRLLRFVAAVFVLAAGTGVVSGLHEQFKGAEDRVLAFTQQATDAHVLFAGDRPLPADAAQGDETGVVTWLAQRLTGVPLRAPDLRSLGYDLSVERILPTDTGPAAQLMYESQEAEQPVTLFIGKGKAGKPTPFTYVQNDNLSIFYWQEGPFAYSLAGSLDRAGLLALSEEVNAQLVALPPAPKPSVQRRIPAADTPAGASGQASTSGAGLERPASNTPNAQDVGVPAEPVIKLAPGSLTGGAAGDEAPKRLLAPLPSGGAEPPRKT